MFKLKVIAGAVLASTLFLQGCSSGGGDNTSSTNSASEVSHANARNVPLTANTLYTLSVLNGNITPEQLNQLKLGHPVTDQTVEEYITSQLQILADTPNNGVSQADVDAFIAQNDLNQVYLDLISLSDSTTQTRYQSRGLLSNIKQKLSDLINPKQVIVNALNTNAGNTVTGAAFDLMLESGDVTVFMLDQARGSDTLTQIMIDALGNNWELTEKMCPMLQTDKEFGEKFAALAYEKPQMANFFFENVDGDMYHCLTDAMALSNNPYDHDESVQFSTTGYMGKLMERHAADFFIAPGSNVSNDSGYGSKDNFSTLMFNTGENVVYHSDTKTFDNHGDGNELANEKLFYTLFQTPDSTEDFVKAMQKLSPATQKLFMDNIFMGISPNKAEPDTYQSYFNNLAIGAGMYEGIKSVGVTAYLRSFYGFFKLIPSDRYADYAKAFINTGYAYMEYQGIDVWGSVQQRVIDAWKNYKSQPDNVDTTSETTNETTTPDATAAETTTPSVRYLTRESNDETPVTNDETTETQNGISQMIEELKAFINDLINNKLKDISVQIKAQALAYATSWYADQTTKATDYIVDRINGLVALVETAINSKLALLGKDPISLPDFSGQAWTYIHNGLIDTSATYYPNVSVADLSTPEDINAYFANANANVHVPKWLLISKDWLTQGQAFSDEDFSFQSGEMRVYVVTDEGNAPEGAIKLPRSTVLIEEGEITTELPIYRLSVSKADLASTLNTLAARYDQIALDASRVSNTIETASE